MKTPKKDFTHTAIPGERPDAANSGCDARDLLIAIAPP